MESVSHPPSIVILASCDSSKNFERYSVRWKIRKDFSTLSGGQDLDRFLRWTDASILTRAHPDLLTRGSHISQYIIKRKKDIKYLEIFFSWKDKDHAEIYIANPKTQFFPTISFCDYDCVLVERGNNVRKWKTSDEACHDRWLDIICHCNIIIDPNDLLSVK